MQSNHPITREQNEHIILSLIMNHPEISRAEIANESGLNKATVSKVVRKLINDSYIIESGRGKSSVTGGRKPILLQINKKAGISFSLDVRFDQISYMASYLNGETIYSESINTPINRANVVFTIEKIISSFKDNLKDIPFGIVGITIAIHGIISDNRIIYTPYYDLDELDLAKELEAKLNIPVYLENEANLATLAEATKDLEHNNLITCSIHTGVGAGIIIDQKLYHGNEGRSGEIGHIPLYPNGIPCPCGSRGCLEQYCSQNALISFYRSAAENPNFTLGDLATNFYNGEELAIQVVKEYSKNLSMGLTSLIANYGPEIVYINSPITRKIPIIIDWIQVFLNHTFYKGVPVKQAKSADNASLYGGCVTSIQNFLNVDRLHINFT